ncbi:hypothetical protein H8356DRAFT_1298006 [Neocallimastix lanati (nom. inval.)]|nr:hypothetical protein H8356DRAFT_1298006 [Neocallimastix sp. JGI-2020a]
MMKGSLIYFFLISYFILMSNVYSFERNINNEDELIHNLNSTEYNILEIYIDNKSIDIYKEIKINNNIQKLLIIGSSKDSSILRFNNSISNGLIFNSFIQKITFKNITIYGHLEFHNVNNVLFEDTILNGSIISNDKSSKNELIQMNNFIYNAFIDFKTTCISLYGNVKIDNSYFYGNSLCTDNILSYDGENINNIDISNSYFNGIYTNTCIGINNANESNITSSIFENGSAYNDGGGAIHAKNSYSFIKNCKFNNNFSSTHGGLIYIETNETNEHINEKRNVYILNSIQHKTENINQSSKQKGLVASVKGNVNLQIENFYAEDLHAGKGISAFTLKGISTIELKNVKMNAIDGSNYGGVLFTSNEEQIGSEFKVTNGTFTNFHQYQVNEASSFIYSHQNINISLNNFIHIGSPTKLELNSVKIENHFTKKDCTFIRCESLSKFDKNVLIFNDLYVDGLDTVKEFVYIDSGDISINNSYLNRIRSSYIYSLSTDDKQKDNYFFRMGSNTNLSISYTNLNNIHTYYGIVSRTSSNIIIENCTFEYSNYDKTLFRIDPKNNINSKTNFTVNNSNFYMISANNGGVAKTSSMNYGGVIYSESKLTNSHVFFNNCEFIPEYNDRGSISYAHCIESEPYFSNADELKMEYDYAFSTNPTKIALSSESLDSISVFSGESIPSNIDDRFISSNFDTMTFDDIIYFRVVINDTNNAVLLGDTISFRKDKCSFPQVKVVGNPGNYKLGLILITYGHFHKFENNAVFVDLEIRDCISEHKNNYNYKDIEGYGFKSCYKPKCSPACVHGKCEDNNQSSIDFMIFILVGLILQCFSMFEITNGQKKNSCRLFQYIFKNIGFSLVYGSMLVKTYRIYLIFMVKKKINRSMKKKNMILIVFGICMIHLLSVFFWIIIQAQVYTVKSANDHRTYSECKYPSSVYLCIGISINIIVTLYYVYITKFLKMNIKSEMLTNGSSDINKINSSNNDLIQKKPESSQKS